MTFRKSGLLSLVLLTAIGMTACRDTVTPPPPPPPLQISITPSGTIPLAVGETAVVTAAVTGGAEGTNRSVTFQSSNPSVATVNATTGLVTAVAPGSATITATAAADPNLRASVQVTVSPAAPPLAPVTISIAAITQGGTNIPVNVNNVAGQIDVVVNLTVPTGQQVSAVEVLMGTTVACRQTFADAAGTDLDVDAAQQTQTIVCSIPTNELDADGRPVFLNQQITVSARAIHPDGTVSATAERQITLMNINILNATVTTTAVAGPGTAPDPTGLLWHEGNVVVNVRPAIFTGGAVTNITICVVQNDPAEAGPTPAQGTTSCRSGTPDASNLLSVSFPKANAMGAAATAGVANVTSNDLRVQATSIVANEQGPALTVAPSPPPVGPLQGAAQGPFIRLDNVMPSAPTAEFPAANQVAGGAWAGANFMFTAATMITVAAVDPGAALSPPSGVGGVNYTFHAIANTAANQALTNAQIVAQGQQITTGSDLAQTDVATSYILVVRARDALGNASFFRLVLPFGVDLTPPTFAVLAGSPANMLINPVTAFTFSFTDERSGFGVNPVWVRIVRHTGAATVRCINVNTGADTAVPAAGCAFVNLTGTSFSVPAPDAYYEITIHVRDRAGNQSDPVDRLILRDNTPPPFPTITTVTITGLAVSIAGTVTDNLHVRSWDTRQSFAGAVAAPTGGVSNRLPVHGMMTVGTFGPAGRLLSVPVASDFNLWHTLTDVPSDNWDNVNGGGFGVYDVARNFNDNYTPATASNQPRVVPANLNAFIPVTLSNAIVCNGRTPPPSGDVLGVACATPTPQPSTTVITAEAQGPSGIFENPFATVHFYRLDHNGNAIHIGSSSVPTLIEQTAPTPMRQYRWTVTLSVTGEPGAFISNVFAVGVSSAGHAFRSGTTGLDIRGGSWMGTP
jgi:hypothetical protein